MTWSCTYSALSTKYRYLPSNVSLSSPSCPPINFSTQRGSSPKVGILSIHLTTLIPFTSNEYLSCQLSLCSATVPSRDFSSTLQLKCRSGILLLPVRPRFILQECSILRTTCSDLSFQDWIPLWQWEEFLPISYPAHYVQATQFLQRGYSALHL